ncbi:MAG: aminotransferase class V-fold PLP-dependent enzyme [Bacilli bacterium]|nr:aminotransferase class V-fold PLP-dependent enzyme [Bacilli bacterium]
MKDLKDEELVNLARHTYLRLDDTIGYPVNQNSNVVGFYDWYTKTGLCDFMMDNVGDPFDEENYFVLSALGIEKRVIKMFAPYYGIPLDKVWGFITNSCTDSNNHGMYFGVKKLLSETGKMPIVYVSSEAHYSNRRLADLQNLECRLIDFDEHGSMDPEDLRRKLDPSRPALVVCALGTTFMGGIDNLTAINKVLDEVKPIAVYKHVDAALFGGYLPFTDHKDLVSMTKMKYDSIAVSGHKFFGIDEPCGLFLTRKDVYAAQTSFKVDYLNSNMAMISCSRSALSPLKFYWLMTHVGEEELRRQAKEFLDNAEYLHAKLTEIGYPAWRNPLSNTVYLKRPADWIVKKYTLAGGKIPQYDGPLCHVVVMQNVTRVILDRFIADIKSSLENK